jgi:hypothetical protein
LPTSNCWRKGKGGIDIYFEGTDHPPMGNERVQHRESLKTDHDFFG